MEKVFEKFYTEKRDDNGEIVSIDFRYGDNFNFAYDILDGIAFATPHKTALCYVGCDESRLNLTYGDISRLSIKMAGMFLADGIGRGDAVMLLMKRRYEYWIAMMALCRIGAIAIPTSHMVTEHDIADRLDRSHAKAVICVNDDYVCRCVEEGISDADVIKYIVGAPRDGYIYASERSEHYPDTMNRIETCATDPMLYYFTSGSSGNPKCVIHSYTYPLAHIMTAANWHGAVDSHIHLSVADSGWAKSAWGKMYGQWAIESTVLVYDYERFYAGEMLRLLADMKVTSFCAPPTIYKYLIREKIEDYDLGSLKQVTSAGEHMPIAVSERFREMTGLTIREGFGQTETPLQVCTQVGYEQIEGSIGRVSPMLRIKLLDDNLDEVEIGEIGEICILPNEDGTTPIGVFTGYLDDDATYAEAWNGGVYHTHDRAYMDAEGNLYYVGRDDDVIKSSGYRIGPSEVEDILMKHPAVRECAVTGYPSGTRGELVKATIILESGYDKSHELLRELQDYVKSNTALYKYPRMIEFVDDMPRTSTGKILRRAIRERDIQLLSES